MNWLTVARELQAIAQTGLHYTQSRFDRERYERIGKLSAEILAGHSNLSTDTFLRWNAAEFGYATPKVDVRGVIFREGKILLVREDQDQGRWTLPGGWADVNETPSESVAREIREESGFLCVTKRLLAVLDRERQGHLPPFPFHVYKMFFLCEIVGGQPTPNPESSALGFFARREIPELSASRVRREQIDSFFRQVEEGHWTTQFD